jgi:hypothetical protein
VKIIPGRSGTPVPAAVVQHLRLVVIHVADSVPAVFAHDAEAFAMRDLLDRIADVAERRARTHRANARVHRLVGGRHQTPREFAGLADEVHAARVAEPAVLDHRDVEVHDVAVAHRPRRRDAVTDHVVDRRAQRFRIAVIADVGWNRVQFVDDVFAAARRARRS